MTKTTRRGFLEMLFAIASWRPRKKALGQHIAEYRYAYSPMELGEKRCLIFHRREVEKGEFPK